MRPCERLAAGQPRARADKLETRDWSDFAAAVAEGDRAVIGAMEEVGDRLADAIVGLVNVLDVPRVVIGGRGLGALAEQFSRTVEERVNSRTIARGARIVEVVPSVVGESVGAIGAASLVLHGSYAPHLSVLLANVP